MADDVHLPLMAGRRQLGRRVSPFVEKAETTWRELGNGKGEQRVQRGEATGGNQTQWREGHGFDSPRVDANRGPGHARGFDQKGGFTGIGFDQMEWLIQRNRESKAGESTAGAEIRRR